MYVLKLETDYWSVTAGDQWVDSQRLALRIAPDERLIPMTLARYFGADVRYVKLRSRT